MRCPRSPFIITDDVRSLNQTLGPAQRGRRTTDVVYPEEPAEHQLRVELVTPGSKRNAPPTTAKSGKQKRRRLGSGALNLVHQVDNQEDGWRVSEDGSWRLERDGNQLLRLPVNGVDIPSNREASLSSGSRENTPNPIDGVSRSIAVASDRLRCYGPASTSRLRGVAEMLAGPAQDASDIAVGKNHCCAQCSSNLAASDGVIHFADLQTSGGDKTSYRLGNVAHLRSFHEGRSFQYPHDDDHVRIPDRSRARSSDYKETVVFAADHQSLHRLASPFAWVVVFQNHDSG
jgi:hypothetical protein